MVTIINYMLILIALKIYLLLNCTGHHSDDTRTSPGRRSAKKHGACAILHIYYNDHNLMQIQQDKGK